MRSIILSALASGSSAARLAHLPWAQEVGGSNPLSPTIISAGYSVSRASETAFVNGCVNGVVAITLSSPPRDNDKRCHRFIAGETLLRMGQRTEVGLPVVDDDISCRRRPIALS